jgi:hypothetical protein
MILYRFATKAFFGTLLVLSLTVMATAQHNVELKKQATARYTKANVNLAFVTEYVRELSAIETIRASAEQVLTQGTNDDKFYNTVYSSTRMQLELRTQINILKGMHLGPPFETIIPDLTIFYTRKVELYQRLIDISSAFIGGPKPGIDYGKLAAEMPQVSAKLDDIDHSLFESTPLIFFTLVDQKTDTQNHVSHLIITRAERAQLLSDITTDFGSKLDQKDQSFQVGAALALKEGLLKDFKSSDDPWK